MKTQNESAENISKQPIKEAVKTKDFYENKDEHAKKNANPTVPNWQSGASKPLEEGSDSEMDTSSAKQSLSGSDEEEDDVDSYATSKANKGKDDFSKKSADPALKKVDSNKDFNQSKH